MKKLLTCLALSTVLFSGCTLMHSSEGIIKVNDTVITQAEFDKNVTFNDYEQKNLQLMINEQKKRGLR